MIVKRETSAHKTGTKGGSLENFSFNPCACNSKNRFIKTIPEDPSLSSPPPCLTPCLPSTLFPLHHIYLQMGSSHLMLRLHLWSHCSMSRPPPRKIGPFTFGPIIFLFWVLYYCAVCVFIFAYIMDKVCFYCWIVLPKSDL